MLLIATFLFCLATTAGFAARWWWPLDLACHFRVQYFWSLSIAAILLAVWRRWKWVLSATVFAAANAAVVVPLFWGPPVKHGDAPTLRVLSLNVLTHNGQHNRVLQMVHEAKPDFFAALEVDSRWADALVELKTEYPYSHQAPHGSYFGLVFYSRYKIESVEVLHLGDFGVPIIVAHCNVKGRPLTIIVAHTFPPMGSVRARQRNLQLAQMAKIAAAQKGPTMLLGDLNITGWSPYFRDLLRDSGLRDSRPGFGVQPTWSAGKPLLRIPIDHCLISSQIEIHDRHVGPNVGSDHYGIIVDFSIRQE